MFRKSLIFVIVTNILAASFLTPSTAFAARKSASTSGVFVAFEGLFPFSHRYRADMSFEWWGYWDWDFYFGNWATAAWNFTHGMTIDGGNNCQNGLYGGPCVAGAAPYGSWTDLVTGEVFSIPQPTFQNIGCIVNSPNWCLQVRSTWGVYMSGKGKAYNTGNFVIWQSSSPWTSRVYPWPRINLW